LAAGEKVGAERPGGYGVPEGGEGRVECAFCGFWDGEVGGEEGSWGRAAVVILMVGFYCFVVIGGGGETACGGLLLDGVVVL